MMTKNVKIDKFVLVLNRAPLFAVAILLSLTILAGGCREESGGHGHGGHTHGGGGHADHGHSHGGHEHDHAADAELKVAHTLWQDGLELFVEYDPLIDGKLSRFAAHFTDMSTYTPIAEGSLTVSLIQAGKGIRNSVDSPAEPGIFQPGLRPKTAGTGKLIFELNSRGSIHRFVINDATVFADPAAAAKELDGAVQDAEISLTKEQTWGLEFGVATVQRGDMFNVIHSSGHIRTRPGDAVTVSAKTAGIVLFNNNAVILGKKFNAGQAMFRISGAGLTADNIRTRYVQSKAAYTKAQADFERAEKLLQAEIISRQDYDALKAELDLARSEFEGLIDNYQDGAQLIAAPISAYVKDVLIDEGEFVENGQALAVLTQNKRLLIEVDVSQRHFKELASIHSANFRTAYSSEVFSIEDLNGRLLSFGRNTAAGANSVPVLFELDNQGDLLPGAFVEVFLTTTPLKAVLFVPRSAVMEDYESHYVYVQTAGESFEKREVELGVDDGRNVQVSGELEEGEYIVVRGAYRVKMAAMSSSIPSHGHSH